MLIILSPCIFEMRSAHFIIVEYMYLDIYENYYIE
jgi:hypothetical protein